MKENRLMHWSLLAGGLVLLLILAGIVAGDSCSQADAASRPFFCPPTPSPGEPVPEATTVTPPTQATEATAPPIPSADCDKAELVSDEPAPPATELQPGAVFLKTWRLKNVGDCTWTTAYQLTFSGGDMMSALQTVQLDRDVAMGEMVDLSVEMIAPDAAGSYSGSWQLKNANGDPFGVGEDGKQPLSVTINVAADTSSPTAVPVDQQAIEVASTVAPQVYQTFGVQINPNGAVGLDEALVNGTAGQLAAWMAPVVDEHQIYTDRRRLQREVEGVFGIRSPNLDLETVVIFSKADIQYPALPEGRYLVACYTPRQNDCLAVSLEGEEFQIRPDSIQIVGIDSGSPPSVEYESGSIYKCFNIIRRRICIRVF